MTDSSDSPDRDFSDPTGPVGIVRSPRSNLPRIEFRRSQRNDAIFYPAAVTAVFLSWIVWLVPSSLSTWVALRIGDLSYFISKKWRANVNSNLSHVLDLPGDSTTVRRVTRRIFHVNALNVVTLLETPHMRPNELIAMLRPIHNDWSEFQRAFDHGTGVIVVTAHLGAFDFVGNAVHMKGYPWTVLTARTTNRFFFDMISFLRRAHNLQLIEASSSGVREVIKVLERGECVGLATDRDFFLSGRPVSFFGEETSLPVGAARLARDTGAMILPMFTFRTKKGHELFIGDAFSVPKSSDKHADLEAGMKMVTSILETAIERAPDQWVMFQRVWPNDQHMQRDSTNG